MQCNGMEWLYRAAHQSAAHGNKQIISVSGKEKQSTHRRSSEKQHGQGFQPAGHGVGHGGRVLPGDAAPALLAARDPASRREVKDLAEDSEHLYKLILSWPVANTVGIHGCVRVRGRLGPLEQRCQAEVHLEHLPHHLVPSIRRVTPRDAAHEHGRAADQRRRVVLEPWRRPCRSTRLLPHGGGLGADVGVRHSRPHERCDEGERGA